MRRAGSSSSDEKRLRIDGLVVRVKFLIMIEIQHLLDWVAHLGDDLDVIPIL